MVPQAFRLLRWRFLVQRPSLHRNLYRTIPFRLPFSALKRSSALSTLPNHNLIGSVPGHYFPFFYRSMMNRNSSWSHPGRPTGRFWVRAGRRRGRGDTGSWVVDSAGSSKDGHGSSRRGKLKGRGFSGELNADSEGLGVGKTRMVEPENRVSSPEAKVSSSTNHSSTLSLGCTVEEDDTTHDKKESGSSMSHGASGKSRELAAAKPFDIFASSSGPPMMLKPSLLAGNRERRNGMKRFMAGENGAVLRHGMVLLKSYLSISDQVKILKLCRDLGLGPGGFYQPGYRDGAKLNLKMMCLGKNWDPDTSQYGDERPTDGAKPPKIPDELHSLVEKAIRDCHSVLREKCKEWSPEQVIPLMSPDICIVNFYSASGRLGLHQDRDESEASLRRGLPVVSFSIGDTAEFLYGDRRDVDKAEKVSLGSGDILVFGGKSRHIFHGVASIITNSAPKILLEETKLQQGRLNLTFREY